MGKKGKMLPPKLSMFSLKLLQQYKQKVLFKKVNNQYWDQPKCIHNQLVTWITKLNLAAEL